MRNKSVLTLALAIMRKSAYADGIQNIGGAVSALANPWIGNQIHPGVDFMKQINPMWQHAQNVWGASGQPPSAPKLPAPPQTAPGPSVAARMPSPPSFGVPGGAGGSAGEAPSFLPKSSAMMQPPKFPAAIKAPGMMFGPKAPPSAGSVFKPVGSAHRPAMGMSPKFGPRYFMGGNGGGGNAGPAAVPTAPSASALSAGSTSAGAGMSSPGGGASPGGGGSK